jgi:lipopolysaccharide exporter
VTLIGLKLTVPENPFRDSKSRSAWLVAYKVFADLASKGVMFVITVVAARRLAPAAFGIFALASTLGWLVALATDFGMQAHVARAVARSPRGAAAILAAWLGRRVWAGAFAIGGMMLALVTWRADAAIAVPILLFAVVYGCAGVIEFLHYFFRGLSRTDIESSLTLWYRSGTLVCGLAALLWRPSVTALAAALAVPAAVTLALGLRIARTIGLTTAPWHAEPRLGTFWSDVFPIGAGTLLSALYFRIDVFLIEWWRGAEAVALYNAVFRLVEALRLFPAAVLAVALPALCRATTFRPVRRVSAVIVGFATVATAVLWISADTVVRLLFGLSFVNAVPAFRILLCAFPLLSLNYALTQQLIAWSGERAYAMICAGALAVNVALNSRLIPARSLDGAAWATVATELFLTIGCVTALGVLRVQAASPALPARTVV